MEHALKNGSYFYIINRGISTQQPLALTFNSDSQNPSLFFLPLDETSHSQIWMVQEVKSNCYEIVHAYSTLALTADKEKAWMQPSYQSSKQLFFVQKSDPKNNPFQYWIKESKLSDEYFQFETKLKCTLSNPKASKCRWQFKRITDKNQIFNSSLIQFAYSGLYMTLPGSSMVLGMEIRQFPLSGRCNQRWKLVKAEEGEGYLIVSTRSKMCLSVKNQKAKNGVLVVQQKVTQSPAQKWKLIHQGLSLYVIASMLKKRLFLGMQGNSMNTGANLMLTNREQYAFWRIIGSFQAAKETSVNE